MTREREKILMSNNSKNDKKGTFNSRLQLIAPTEAEKLYKILHLDTKKGFKDTIEKLYKVFNNILKTYNLEEIDILTYSYWSYYLNDMELVFKIGERVSEADKQSMENLSKIFSEALSRFSLTEMAVENDFKNILCFSSNDNDILFKVISKKAENNKILKLNKEEIDPEKIKKFFISIGCNKFRNVPFEKDGYLNDDIKQVFEYQKTLFIKKAYLIPIYSENSTKSVYGLFVIAFKNIIKIPYNILELLKLIANGIFAEFNKIELEHLVKQNALFSGISSIMIRNMSHNIGSHVLTRATIGNIFRRYHELF